MLVKMIRVSLFLMRFFLLAIKLLEVKSIIKVLIKVNLDSI